jgi:peptide deformylase
MKSDLGRMRIIIYPDPRLRKACKPVEQFDKDLAALAERMIELMHEAKGVGLAAPQVGVLQRLFVCNTTGEPNDNRVFVNPTLTDLTGDVESEEGCLSIPDVTVPIRRANACVIEAQDLSGKRITFQAADLPARCWQHECDHLDGRLIIDRMSETDRIAQRRTLKQLESQFKQPAR